MLGQPGAMDQVEHRDADAGYSLLLPATKRRFCFEGEVLTLLPGQFLLFPANRCHWGAGLSASARRPSIAIHIFGGSGDHTRNRSLLVCAKGRVPAAGRSLRH